MVRLTNTECPFFFEDRHHELAASLEEKAQPLLEAENGTAAGAAARVAAEMGRLGLYEYLVPVEGDVDVRSVCLIREWLAYHSPLADAIYAVQGLGSFPLKLAGTSSQEAGLAELRQGKRIAGFGLTEPEAGSDVASMQTRAHLQDSGLYLLTGHKTLISNVGIAQQYVVFANANPDAGRKGIAAFLVQADAPGLEHRKILVSDGHPLGELVMKDCEAELIGELGAGFRIAMSTLDRFRVSVGAAAVGMSNRALDEATNHVRQRRQFGKPLGEQQLVQAHLADMATERDAARLLVYRAARAADTSAERVSKVAAMAKLYATEAASRIVDTAVQLFGGKGVISASCVESLYRSVRPLRIYEGTSEIQRLIIGRAIVKGEG
jgi:acyl-CoA dehydrogenase